MSRIQKLQKNKLTKEQKLVYEKIVSGPRGEVRGPLSVWLRRPELAKRAESLGCYCRFESSLDRRLSELAILVTAKIWGSGYEWHAHIELARKAGISDTVIHSINLGLEPIFDKEDEAIIYQITRELYFRKKITARTFKKARKNLGEGGLVDLIGILGYYSFISMTINVFEIPVQKGEYN